MNCPPEIECHILSFLEPDNILYYCSTVCRRWQTYIPVLASIDWHLELFSALNSMQDEEYDNGVFLYDWFYKASLAAGVAPPRYEPLAFMAAAEEGGRLKQLFDTYGFRNSGMHACIDIYQVLIMREDRDAFMTAWTYDMLPREGFSNRDVVRFCCVKDRPKPLEWLLALCGDSWCDRVRFLCEIAKMRAVSQIDAASDVTVWLHATRALFEANRPPNRFSRIERITTAFDDAIAQATPAFHRQWRSL